MKKENSKKSVVMSIISHNQYNLIKSLIQSLETKLILNEVDLTIVITHNSTNSPAIFSQRFDITNRFALHEKGFGDNHNIVFESYDSDYFFVMNPDLIFYCEFDLDKITEFLNRHDIDISSPTILNIDGSVADYKRGKLTPISLLKRYIKANVNESFTWYCGMFLIFKSSSYRKLKGFDPKYYMYLEDCDICIRARSAGMYLHDLSDVSVTHVAQRGSRKSLKLFRFHVLSLLKFWLNI